jgi:pilus assembly protein CpaF
VREQISSAVQVVVQASRLADGARRVMSITEVTGMEGDMISAQEIFRYRRTGLSPEGKVLGRFEPTGVRPVFAEKLRAAGVELPGNLFEPRDGA